MSYSEAHGTRAIVLGAAIVVVGLAILVVAAGIRDDSALLAVGALVVIGGVVRLTTALSADARRRRMADPDDPRWDGQSRFVQLAGRACVVCNKKITVAGEAVACDVCDGPVHLDCEQEHDATAHQLVVLPRPS